MSLNVTLPSVLQCAEPRIAGLPGGGSQFFSGSKIRDVAVVFLYILLFFILRATGSVVDNIEYRVVHVP